MEDVADAEEWRWIDERALCQRARKCRNRNRRQWAHRIAAEDEFVAVERASERSVEGCGDRRSRTRADEYALIGAAQTKILPDFREDAGTELAVTRLHADRDTR